MIRINLLKGTAFQLEKPKRIRRGGKAPRRIWIGLAVLLAVLGGGTGLTIYMMGSAPAPKVEEKRVAQPPSAAALRGVEETVRDVSEAKSVITSKGLLLLPYEEMTQNEKLLYASTFLRRAFSTVNRYADRGVDFNTMRIEDFTTFYILGVTRTREDFTTFRNRLEKDPSCAGMQVLLAKPTGSAIGAFRFELQGKLQFGLDYETLMQSNPFGRIPGHSEFNGLIRRIREVGEPGIEWTRWNPVGMNPEGVYNRHGIEMEGITSYRFCVDFLNNRIPELNSMVAFSKFDVKAVGKGKIKFAATVFFYTKPD